MMILTDSGKKFNLSYRELREKYIEIKSLSNKEFRNRLPEILHFAVFCSYVKELGLEATVGEEGVIHGLVHLLHIPNCRLIDIRKIRSQFNRILKLD